MKKGELRKFRRAARAEGATVEIVDGRPQIVRPRTRREEAAHERRMERWARRGMSSDPDWR